MGNLQIIFTTVLFMLPVTWFNGCGRIIADVKGNIRLRYLICPKKNIMLSFVLGIVGGIVLLTVSRHFAAVDCRNQMITLFVYTWLITVACCDGKERRIPNSWILYGVAVWAIFLLLEVGMTGSTDRLYFSLRGVLAGAGMMMAGASLKRGGVGMGDIKLYLVLGLFLGCQGVLRVMLAALTGASVYGLALMALGRLERGGRIPIGPFTYLGFIAVTAIGKLL